EVAVDDAATVRFAEPARDLAEEDEHLERGESSTRAETLAQRLAVEELHRDEVHLDGRILDAAIVEERDDVRVLELREDARLEEEALEELRLLLVDGVCFDDLQRDGPVERCLAAEVDAAHSTACEGLLDEEFPIDDGTDERIARRMLIPTRSARKRH